MIAAQATANALIQGRRIARSGGASRSAAARLALLACLAAASLPMAARAQPTELAGNKIEQSVQLAGSALQLNGAGIRTRFFIKVYTAALYTPNKVDTAEAVVSAPGPKRILITMLRDIDSNELGKLFTQGMERNTPREDMSRSISGIIRMGELFAKRKRLKAGDTFSVDWVPGVGAQVLLNGHAEIEAIKEPEFFKALLSIWLGKVPADEDLKAALLGRTVDKRPSSQP